MVFAEVPPGLVTVTATVPEPFGEVTLISVAEMTLSTFATAVPKWTAVGSRRFVPVIVTVVPPEAGPLLGESFVTLGRGKIGVAACLGLRGGPAGAGNRDGDRARALRRGDLDLGRRDDLVDLCRGSPEVDGGRLEEVRARDRDGRAARGRPLVGRELRDPRAGKIGDDEGLAVVRGTRVLPACAAVARRLQERG